MGSEVRPLTGLRGVAALYVVTYHFTQGMAGGTAVATALQHGYLAVDLFFILSGFVLAMVHGRDTFDEAGYRRFLGKRFARVYPLYAVVTLATVVLGAAVGDALFSPGRLLVNVALMQGWGVGSSIVAPAWSLSAEVAAYLLFPLLSAALLWGARTQAAALAGAALLLLAFIAEHSTVPRSGPLDLYQSNTVAPLVRCLCEFSLGLLAFRASRTRLVRRLAEGAAMPAVTLAIIALLFLHGIDLAIVVLLPALIAALFVRPNSVVGRLLGSPPVFWLGTVSFSVYLTHFLLRDRMREPLAGWLATHGFPHADILADFLTIAAILVIAEFTFNAIERPARALFRARLQAAPSAS